MLKMFSKHATVHCVQMHIIIPCLLYIYHIKHKKRLLLTCIHHFKTGLIYNMDHIYNIVINGWRCGMQDGI